MTFTDSATFIPSADRESSESTIESGPILPVGLPGIKCEPGGSELELNQALHKSIGDVHAAVRLLCKPHGWDAPSYLLRSGELGFKLERVQNRDLFTPRWTEHEIVARLTELLEQTSVGISARAQRTQPDMPQAGQLIQTIPGIPPEAAQIIEEQTGAAINKLVLAKACVFKVGSSDEVRLPAASELPRIEHENPEPTECIFEIDTLTSNQQTALDTHLRTLKPGGSAGLRPGDTIKGLFKATARRPSQMLSMVAGSAYTVTSPDGTSRTMEYLQPSLFA